MLPDPERSDLRFQRRTRHPELGRGARWSGYTSVAFRECRFDHLPFVCRELRGKRSHPFRRLLAPEPTRIDLECFGFADDDGTLDHVLQLADVAGPTVRLHELQRLLLDVPDGFACIACVPL